MFKNQTIFYRFKNINIINKYKLFIVYNLNIANIFYFKKLFLLFIFITVISNQKALKDYNIKIKGNYINSQIKLNFTFHHELKKKIRIAIYSIGLKNGGTERITALLINYFCKTEIFKLYLFTKKIKENNEFYIPEIIKRYTIKGNNSNNLIQRIKKQKIDILIYQFSNYHEINILNELRKTKVLFYNHFSLFYWVYFNFKKFILLYSAFQKSKYIISLIHLENDYLFKKWGISSILMNNFITYDYNSTISSELSTNTIIMFGRIHDKYKRFDLGISSMEYIIQEIKECKMKIISNLENAFILDNLINNLNLKNNIIFIAYTSSPEIFFKNISLHLFPSLSEAFPMVLSETKIYGIPNILLGLDYISMKEGGTIVLYDDIPESLSKSAMKVLKNDKFKKKLSKEARKDLRKYNNANLLIKWTKLILSIYYDNIYYQKLRNQVNKISENESLMILNNQIKLLRKRNKIFYKFTIKDFLNSINI